MEAAAKEREHKRKTELTPGPTVLARMLKLRSGSRSMKTFSSGHLRCGTRREQQLAHPKTRSTKVAADAGIDDNPLLRARHADSPSAHTHCPSRPPLPSSARAAHQSGSTPG